MLTVLVDTFGQELRVKDQEIGEYLRKFEIKAQSPSFPFKNIEPIICWMIISPEKQKRTMEDMAHLGYHFGSADVPCVPIVFVGVAKKVPKEMRLLDSVFCTKMENLEAILEPLIATFSKSRDVLEMARAARVDERLRLREKLISEVLNAMKTQGYIEEFQERL